MIVLPPILRYHEIKHDQRPHATFHGTPTAATNPPPHVTLHCRYFKTIAAAGVLCQF